MNNKLYKEFASYYADMSGHRNFRGQLDCIVNSYEPQYPCRSFLELFAGQALHSIEALKNGNIDVWAIDASPEMKQLALTKGFKNPHQYIVGNVPEAILNCVDKVKFDCIICLYHGLSNLTMPMIYETFNYLKKVLNTHGKVFIEVHNIYKIMEYMSTPGINFTEIKNSNDEIVKFAWPGGKIKWNPFNYNAEVPVQLIVQSSKGVETIDFISEEYIYCADEIIFIAGLLGYSSKIVSTEVIWKRNFGNSIILELSFEEP